MKIHVLPIDKPSRLHEFGNIWFSHKEPTKCFRNYDIYITDDSEIKPNDYITDGYKVWKWKDDSSLLGRKKVILTTDQDLIADGVQGINNDFLEWLVKNPSCKFVEIGKECIYQGKCKKERCLNHSCDEKQYKIIIPQGEHKQTVKEYEKQGLEKYFKEHKQERMIDSCHNFNKEIGCVQAECRCEQEEFNYNGKDEIFWISNNQQCKQIESCYGSLSKKCICVNEELIEETIEKVAKKRWGNVHRTGVLGFIEGAKWQAERMYSEEEVLKILLARNVELGIIDKTSEVEEWFNQFKKK